MKTVIVKFQVSNSKLLVGVPVKVRNEQTIQTKRAESGFQNQNVRAGVIDTGTCVEYKSASSVTRLIDSLLRGGRSLTDLHYYVKSNGSNCAKKYVVVATFSDQGNKINGRAIDALIDSVWSNVFVWTNPNNTVTVNCNGKIPSEQKPAKVIDVPLIK
jgi:hypothetical protein